MPVPDRAELWRLAEWAGHRLDRTRAHGWEVVHISPDELVRLHRVFVALAEAATADASLSHREPSGCE